MLSSKILTREEYKDIKRMDRVTMENYLNNLVNINYTNGYNAGVVAMTEEVANRVDIGIKNTPGIGEKRYNALISNITAEITRGVV